MALNHDTFSRDTRAQPKQLIEAVSQLYGVAESAQAAYWAIGLITPRDKGKTLGSRRSNS